MMKSMIESFNMIMPKTKPGKAAKGVFGLTKERKIQKEMRERPEMTT